MIKYIWIVMIVIIIIYWMIYAIADTIITFKKGRKNNFGFSFKYLEESTKAFYIGVIAMIFFYSLFSYFLS